MLMSLSWFTVSGMTTTKTMTIFDTSFLRELSCVGAVVAFLFTEKRDYGNVSFFFPFCLKLLLVN